MVSPLSESWWVFLLIIKQEINMAKVTYKGPNPLDDPIYKVGFIIGGKRLGKLKTKNQDKEQSDDQKE